MELAGRQVVIVGLGLSGVAAARLCRRRGATVLGTDASPVEKLGAAAQALADAGVELRGGGHRAEDLLEADLVVVSPGVPSLPVFEQAAAAGVELVSELDLAARFVEAPLVLVGGTNGKSTVTALVGAVLAAAGKRVFVGGNYGTPLSEAVGEPWDVLVVEISSFQAERVPTLHPRVHALLNISEDHLDRYPSFEHYAEAKGNPFLRMTPEDVAVIPAKDALCLAQAQRGQARHVTFGVEQADAAVAVEGDHIVDRRDGWTFPLAELRIPGLHNAANACAAVACASAMGSEAGATRQALAEFSGLEHRTVLVGEIGGIPYYDDSKGTNVGATVAALRGLSQARGVLIAGGRDKQGELAPLVEALQQRGRALVVLGEAAERMATAAAEALPVTRVDTIAAAVAAARRLAEPGDAVLLSPACSSFDMFRNYQERGEAFAAAVQAATRGEEETS